MATAFSRFKSHESFVRIRRELPATVIGPDGRPTPVTDYSLLDFDGTRDPLPNEYLALLPEGERKRGVMLLYTETELRSIDDNRQVVSDYIFVDGELWEVRETEFYPRIIPHYEARIERIKIPSGSTLDAAIEFALS